MESDSSLFLCQPCTSDDHDGSILNGIKVKVVANHDNDTLEMISEWLQSLTGVKLSDEYWLNEDDKIFSPSIGSIDKESHISYIAQRLFESLPINNITREDRSLQLFPTEEIRNSFDTNLIAALHTIIDDEIVSRRTSNKHPLKIQFLACPSNYNFKLHSHPNIELCIPITGTLYERRLIGMTLHPMVVERELELTKPTPTSKEDDGDKNIRKKLYQQPTDSEIKQVHNSLKRSLGRKVTTLGRHGKFVDRKLNAGQVLVNDIGSIHQSYTKDDGCLILAIWSGLHADIDKGCDCCGIEGNHLLVL